MWQSSLTGCCIEHVLHRALAGYGYPATGRYGRVSCGLAQVFWGAAFIVIRDTPIAVQFDCIDDF